MSYQHKDEQINLSKIEDMRKGELSKIWSEIKRKYKNNRNDPIDFDFISDLILRSEDFEEGFRIEIQEFCKNDLDYICIRGTYDMFAHFYKKKYSDIKPLKNKDNVSRAYISAKNKISDLLDKYYIPEEKQDFGIPELDLSTEEIEKFMRVVDGIIFELELTPNKERKFAVDSAHTALSWIGLPKTSRAIILTIFRKLQKEDPLLDS